MADAVVRGHLPRLPASVENAEAIGDGLELYWTAYAELTTCRPQSYGGCPPIPWTAVATYAQFHRFDYDQFNDLVYFVRQLDDTYAKWYDKHEARQKPVGK